MKLELRDRARLIRELIVAEVLALPGRGPLALRARVPPPRGRASGSAGRAELPAQPSGAERPVGPERGR